MNKLDNKIMKVIPWMCKIFLLLNDKDLMWYHLEKNTYNLIVLRDLILI